MEMEALYADGGFPCRRNQLSRQQISTKSCQDTPGSSSPRHGPIYIYIYDELMLNVLRCHLTY